MLSRKLAAGAESLVVDVKWGNGSFIKDVEQAKVLARSITRVGRSMKRRCVALVTDMNQPLGDTVGTALELQEAVQLLKGEGRKISRNLSSTRMKSSGYRGRWQYLSAKTDRSKALKTVQPSEIQGDDSGTSGNPAFIDDPSLLPKAKHVRKLPAPKRGYVHTINAGMIARGVQILQQTPKEDRSSRRSVRNQESGHTNETRGALDHDPLQR